MGKANNALKNVNPVIPMPSGAPAKRITYSDLQKKVGGSAASDSMPKGVIKGGK
jgi:hypothetical protein